MSGIRITSMLNEADVIQLPEWYEYTVSDEESGTEIQMADGSIVYENPALRRTVTVSAGAIPNAEYRTLLRMRRESPFVMLQYTDVGEEVTGIFRMSVGERKLFKFDENGVPMFTGCELTFIAREAD